MKHRGVKRLLSAVLAVALLVSALPMTAFADYWAPEQVESISGYKYYYTGTEWRPEDHGAGGASRNNVIIESDKRGADGSRLTTPLQKYQLAELDMESGGNGALLDPLEGGTSLFAYCSDLHIPPREYFKSHEGISSENLRYRRISLESITPSQDSAGRPFFTNKVEGEFEQRTTRLRAIMISSDLWVIGTDGYDAGSSKAVAGLAELQSRMDAFYADLADGAVDTGSYNLDYLSDTQRADMVALAAKGVKRLGLSDIVAATQLAVWHVVNDAEYVASTGNAAATAWNSAEVRQYYYYLLSLQGVGTDFLASIAVDEIGKTLHEIGNGDSTLVYDVKVAYSIIGQGVASGQLPESITMEAKLADGTVIGNMPSATGLYYEHLADEQCFVLRNIPADSQVNLRLSGTQKDVKSVYLFDTMNHQHSQVLVSVMTAPVELKTSATIDLPAGMKGLTFYKRWSRDGLALPAALVAGNESYFRISYHSPGEHIDGTAVWNGTIVGNGEAGTGDIFLVQSAQQDQLYKLEETGWRLAGESDITPNGGAVAAKYFRMVPRGDSAVVQWTDADGSPLDTETRHMDRFLNPVADVATGDVSIYKTVTTTGTPSDSVLDILKREGFTVELRYLDGGDIAQVSDVSTLPLYTGAAYTYQTAAGQKDGLTGPDGRVSVSAETAITLKNVPQGWTIVATEVGDLTDTAWTAVTGTGWKISGDSKDGIELVNRYSLGSLEITKRVEGLAWPAGAQYTFDITGPKGYSATVTLDAQKTSHKLENLLWGEYKVTEQAPKGAAAVANYAVLVEDGAAPEGTDAKLSGRAMTVTVAGEAVASFVNRYVPDLGRVTVTKTYVDDRLEVNTPVNFTFELWKVGGTEPYATQTVQVPSQKSSGTPISVVAEFLGVPVGDYYIKETGLSAPGEAGYVFKVNGVKVVSGTGDAYQSSNIQVKTQESINVSILNSITERKGTLSIAKAFEGLTDAAAKSAGVTVTVEGSDLVSGGSFSERVTLNSGNGWKWSREVTPGTYTVTEVEYTVGNFTYKSAGWVISGGGTGSGLEATVTVGTETTHALTFTNTYERNKGQVAFEKSFVTNGHDPQAVATFVLDFSEYADGMTYQIGTAAAVGITAKTGTKLTLADGQRVVISGMPEGSTVKVTETLDTSLGNVFTSTVNGNLGQSINLTATGTLDAASQASFVNTRALVDLTVSKAVQGLEWGTAITGDVVFQINGPKGWYHNVSEADRTLYRFAAVAGTSDTYTFVLTAERRSLALTGLPAGTYVVNEQSWPSEDGYGMTTSAVATGTGTVQNVTNQTTFVFNKDARTGTVTYTNRYYWKVGTVGLGKIEGPYVPRNTYEYLLEVVFDRDVRSAGMGGAPATAVWAEDGKSFTLWIKGGEFFVLTDVPEGTVVIVTETKYREINGDGTEIAMDATNSIFKAPAYSVYTGTVGSSMPTGKFVEGNSVTMTDQGSFAIRIYNEAKDIGQLTVKKLVEGDYAAGDAFSFTLALYNADTGKYVTVSGGSFKLTKDGSNIFKTLPLGATYRVTEGTSSSYSLVGIAAEGGDVTTKDRQAEGVITDAAQTVTYTNKRTTGKGTLTIEKSLLTGGDSLGWDSFGSGFEFTIAKSDGKWNATDDQLKAGLTATSTAGAYTFTLTEGKASIILTGLPVGQYVITEGAASFPSAYSHTLSIRPVGVTGTTDLKARSFAMTYGDSNATVTFENAYTLRTSQLTIEKAFAFSGKGSWETAPTASGTVTFTLYEKLGDGDWRVYDRIGAGETLGQFTMTLSKGKGTASLAGLRAEGATYFVAEHDMAGVTGVGGYTFRGVTGAVLLSDVTGKTSAEIDGLLLDAAKFTAGKTKQTVTNTYDRQLGAASFTKTLLFGGEGIDLPGDLAGQRFSFTLKSGSTEVAKFSLVAGDDRSLTVASSKLPAGSITMADGAVSISNLPVGKYSVVEDLTGIQLVADKYTRGPEPATAELNVTVDGENRAAITNDYSRQTGSLLVSKTVTGSGPASWEYSFEVYESDASGTVIAGKAAYATFKLNDENKSKLLDNMPQGYYVVRELSGGTEREGFNMTVWMDGTQAQQAVVKVGGTQTELPVVNHFSIRGATLTVIKDTEGVADDLVSGKAFTFELRRADDTDAGWQGMVSTPGFEGATWQDGVMTFTVIAGAGITIELPEGTYELRETTAGLEVDGHTYRHTTYANGAKIDSVSGDINPADDSDWVSIEIGKSNTEHAEKALEYTFCNSYTKDGSLLILEKAVDGYAPAKAEFTFKVMYEGEGGKLEPIYENPETNFYPVTIDPETGAITRDQSAGRWVGKESQVTVPAGQKVMLEGLDPNRTVVVWEVLGDGSLYRLDNVSYEAGYYRYTVDGASTTMALTGNAWTGSGIVPADDAAGTVRFDTGVKDGAQYPCMHLTYKNLRLTGDIQVTKAVAGPSAQSDIFYITVSFKDGGAGVSQAQLEALKTAGSPLNVTGAASWEIGEAGIVIGLKAGQTATITGVPAGLSYTVLESAFSVDDLGGKAVGIYQAEYQTGTAGEGGTVWGAGSDRAPTGVVAPGAAALVQVVNTRETGTIELIKQIVTSGEADTEAAFEARVVFDIAGTGWSLEDIAGYFEVSSGYADAILNPRKYIENDQLTITLGLLHDRTATISRVPAGLSYEIFEDLDQGQAERYISGVGHYGGFVYPAYDGTGKEQNKDRVEIRNYDVPKGSLVVTKEVEAYEGADVQSALYDELFEFSLELFGASEDEMYGYYQAKLLEQTALVEAALRGDGTEENTGVLGRIAALEAELAGLDDFADSFDAALLALAQAGVQPTDGGELAQRALAGALEAGELELSAAGLEALSARLLAELDGDEEAFWAAYGAACGFCEAGRVPGEADCTAEGCEGGMVTRTATCETCGGAGGTEEEPCTCDSGKIEVSEPCGACEGTGKVGTTEKCDVCGGAGFGLSAEAIGAELARLVDAFEAEEAVGIARQHARLSADLAEAEGLRDKILNIQTALGGEHFITFDETTFELIGEAAEKGNDRLPKLIISDDGESQVHIRRGSEKVGLEGRFEAVASEDGYSYTFWLKHTESLLITGLPAGTRYSITEKAHPGLAGEAASQVVAKVGDGEEQSFDGGDCTVGGTIAMDAQGELGTAVIVQYTNIFERPTGRLSVNKVWPDGSGEVESITIQLVRDGLAVGQPVTIRPEDGVWSYTFQGLELGHVYTVVETVPEGFVGNNGNAVELKYGSTEGSITVTNTLEPEEPVPPTPIDPGYPEQPDPEDPKPVTPEEPATPTEPEENEPVELPEELEAETPIVAMPPDEIKIPEEEELEVETPTGSLPNTGGASASGLLSLFGGSFIGLGALLGRGAGSRKKKDD